MPKTSEQKQKEAAQRAHEIVASQGGKYSGSYWVPKHDKPIPKSNKG